MLNSREHSSKSSEKLDKEVKSKYKIHKTKFIKMKLENNSLSGYTKGKEIH